MFLSRETGISGNFVGRIKGAKNGGEATETVTDFILGGSKISADGDCSQKLQDACCLEVKL